MMNPRCAAPVKNKTYASVQITAEQILRDAREQHESECLRPPRYSISDEEELAKYHLQKRKQFEDLVRRVRQIRNGVTWVKYAQWEAGQGDFARARSVWERALEIDYKNSMLWLKYFEMEMKHKFVNHARNVMERAVLLLPRVDNLWWRYIHMEEVLGNVRGARQIFERWMAWEPGHNGWDAYVRFEIRWKEMGRARGILDRARQQCMHDQNDQEKFFVEEEEKLFEGLKRPLSSSEVQCEEVLVRRKRLQYEEEVKKEPLNYDHWFDYARLEESVGEKEQVREIYERAIANKPPADQKRYWNRYIYLWINYALYEELECEDYDRTRAVFKACLGIIPHEKFTFAKLWIMTAKFEIRQKNLKAARNVDRCRTLCGRYLEWSPSNCRAWIRYVELEKSLGEIELARAIFEIAVQQPLLDLPELMWKVYIEFEISQKEHGRTRVLYERLLDRTRHLKVWLSYAKFEAAAQEDSLEPDTAKVAAQAEERAQRSRRVFERAYESVQKKERIRLLKEWKDAEHLFGEFGDPRAIKSKQAMKLVKQKHPLGIVDADLDVKHHELCNFEDGDVYPNLEMILEIACRWKLQKIESNS